MIYTAGSSSVLSVEDAQRKCTENIMPDFLKSDCPQVLLSCEICDSHQAKKITTPSPPEAELIKLARTGWQIWQLQLCRAVLGMEAAKSWQSPKLQTNEITRNFQRADSSWGWCSKEAGWNAACWSFSINCRQLAQTETSLHCEHSEVEETPPPPWLTSGISITAATEAGGASVLGQQELRTQTSSSNWSQPTIPSAQDFSVVTKTTPKESPGIQISPADTWLWKRESYTQLFLTG